MLLYVHRNRRLIRDGSSGRPPRLSHSSRVQCCFTSTETVGLLGTGAQDGHLDFHTPPELVCDCFHWWSLCTLHLLKRPRENFVVVVIVVVDVVVVVVVVCYMRVTKGDSGLCSVFVTVSERG